jgi:putative acetyltransferase
LGQVLFFILACGQMGQTAQVLFFIWPAAKWGRTEQVLFFISLYAWRMIEVVRAQTGSQLDAVRDVMRAFVAWHRERHVEDRHLIDEYFSAGDFEHELGSLPGKYSPPSGRLLLANSRGECAGCVALRALDERVCEMKRMFVYPRFHGQGVGRALAKIVIQEARAIGYTSMLLDTSVRQVEALGLYESLGFVRVEPYYELPEALQRWLVFMRLNL